MKTMHKEHTLTKNQQIIFDLIDKSPEPMKAYSILFNVQKKGIKAPLQAVSYTHLTLPTIYSV